MDALAIAAGHGLSVPNLRGARQLSQTRISTARAHLTSRFTTSDLGVDVIAFGSLARHEVTKESDFDYLVVATGMPRAGITNGLLDAADELRRIWATQEGRQHDTAGPGTTGLFGQAIGAFDLVEQIGLQRDTNHSLTRRMLLIEESVSLLSPQVYGDVLHETLVRYLSVSPRTGHGPPRFLLNDVLRYWHTLTVDYQAKSSSLRGPSGLRFLKLIVTRKLVHASTLLTLLLCGKEGMHLADPEGLADILKKPPIDRLVVGYEMAPPAVQEAMLTAIGALEAFLDASADRDWRSIVGTADPTAATHGQEFTDMKGVAASLQQALDVIFFDWPLIRADSRHFLVF